MKANLEGILPQQPKDNIGWVISEYHLSALNLPQQELIDGKHLRVTVEGKEIKVGIFTLPKSQETSQPEAQTKPSPTQLEIKPKIDFDDALPGLHTPQSALHPYVLMEDGTRYAIAIGFPTEWMSEWSDKKERPAHGIYSREVYREKESVSFLVRLDGETPLAEQQKNIFGQLIRKELMLGIEPKEKGNENTTIFISKRQVIDGDKNPNPEENGSNSRAFDLEFHVIAQRGTKENATLDRKGLVDVVVVRCTEDEVIERISDPSIIHDSQTLRSPSLSFRSEMHFGDLGNRTKGMPQPDSTRKGETKFTNERREKVSVQTVKNIRPVARFKLALVGSGGPIKRLAEEKTPMPTK